MCVCTNNAWRDTSLETDKSSLDMLVWGGVWAVITPGCGWCNVSIMQWADKQEDTSWLPISVQQKNRKTNHDYLSVQQKNRKTNHDYLSLQQTNRKTNHDHLSLYSRQTGRQIMTTCLCTADKQEDKHLQHTSGIQTGRQIMTTYLWSTQQANKRWLTYL